MFLLLHGVLGRDLELRSTGQTVPSDVVARVADQGLGEEERLMESSPGARFERRRIGGRRSTGGPSLDKAPIEAGGGGADSSRFGQGDDKIHLGLFPIF
jgi:hypothetical protein